ALSSTDVRIAWVGWVLRLVVWSIRSIVESAYRAVVLVQRALSREMEMQADLVSVSVTGSDALVHALHQIQAADDCWERPLGFASGEKTRKRYVRDLFAVQSRIAERMLSVLDDSTYRRPAAAPAEHPERHRVFGAQDAQPPRMWMSHPPNHEREVNAKRRYIAAEADERSAWD